MKTIVFTIFIVHSAWANLCPFSCGCKSDYEYNLEVKLKRGEEVCGTKSPIKEGWYVEKDHFKCHQRIGTEWWGKMVPLDQPNAETFNKEDDGKSRIPTTGTYRFCLKVKCVEFENCTVTLTKNGARDEILKVESESGSTKETCVSKELKNTDEVQVNLMSTDNDACLDTDDKANNRLTIKLEEKTKGQP